MYTIRCKITGSMVDMWCHNNDKILYKLTSHNHDKTLYKLTRMYTIRCKITGSMVDMWCNINGLNIWNIEYFIFKDWKK